MISILHSARILGLVLIVAACSDSGESEKPSSLERDASPGSGQATARPATKLDEASSSALSPSRAPQVLEAFEVGANVYVRALTTEPAANGLWVGTSAGVHEIDLETKQLRRTFTRQDGLANEYVFAIFVDHQGYKWFGTNAGGVSRYRGGKWKTFFPMHGLADYWVYSFAEQKDGTLWIGTWEGVNRVDPLTVNFRTYIDELVNEWVYGIDVDSKDRVWFATEGGVSMYDGDSWSSWSHLDGLGAANAEVLPPSKNTGVGTSGGVIRYDTSTDDYRLFDVRSGLLSNGVFHLSKLDDKLAVGTYGGGLSLLDPATGTWENFNIQHGLADSFVYDVLKTASGDIWIATWSGANRVRGARLDDRSSWELYTVENTG